MPLFRGRRLSFTSNSGSAKARSGSVHRVSPDHAMALRDPVMQTMRATLLQEEALRSGAGGKKQYEVPMPRTYDDFVRQASQKKVVAAPAPSRPVAPAPPLATTRRRYYQLEVITIIEIHAPSLRLQI